MSLKKKADHFVRIYFVYYQYIVLVIEENFIENLRKKLHVRV